MSESSEWGPWVEHDGGNMPCAGHVQVRVKFRIPLPQDCFPMANPECDRADAWVWSHDGSRDDIVAYRIRRPRALRDLIDLIENLPAPSGQKEDA